MFVIEDFLFTRKCYRIVAKENTLENTNIILKTDQRIKLNKSFENAV